MADVKIVMSSRTRGQVFVDGVEITRICAIEFTAAVDAAAELRITLRPKTVEIEGPAEVIDVPLIEVTNMEDDEPRYVSGDPRADR